jgi:hypothetical protein
MHISIAPVSQSYFFQSPREARLAAEHHKLTRSVIAWFSAARNAAAVGPDPLVDQLAAALGFGDNDLVITRALIGKRMCTVVAVPTRVWKDPESRQDLEDLRGQAQDHRIRLLFVAQRWLRAPVRSQIAAAIHASRNARFSLTERNSVVDEVRARRIITIADCAGKVAGNCDPYGVVLALCAQGYLLFDRSSAIGPETWIALPDDPKGTR